VPSPGKDLDVFRAFVAAGQGLAEIHVHYEQQPEYPLKKVEKAGEKLDYRVAKMKLSKDKPRSSTTNSSRLAAYPLQPTNTALATVPLSNGSSINIRSQPTSAAASRTTQIERTTRNPSSASSAR
jgi:hypothetical protein